MSEVLKPQEEEELNHMTLIGEEAKFHEALKAYEQIPIPDKLNELVHKTIEEYTQEHTKYIRKMARRRGMKITLRTLGSMAAALLLFFIPLNTNEAFAKQMQSIPVIGKLAEVLTVRSYSYQENDTNVNINVPEIIAGTNGADTADSPQEDLLVSAYSEDAGEIEGRMKSDEDLSSEQARPEAEAQEYGEETSLTAGFIGDVNAEIQSIIDTYEEDAKARFAQYKEAFFETGGTQEEWGGRTCDIDVDYEVTYNEGNVLSLVLTTTESWVAVYGARYYYNLDLKNGAYLTLQDLLGDDWVTICNESIVEQIETRLAQDSDNMLTYWGYGADEGDEFEEGFTGVDENTDFYINAAGNPVICFDKYEIAPGFMGVQEFEITG